MTREEKERIQQKLHRAADAHLNAYGGNLYYEGVARGLEQAAGIIGKVRCEEEQRWIPCSERMPDDGKWCLFTDGENMSVERYKLDAIDHFFPNGRWFDFDEAVAWMPLPEPWKGEEDGGSN